MSFTTQDFTKLRQVIKEEVRFALEEQVEPRFKDLEQKFDNLQTSVDGYAKTMATFNQEHFILKQRVDRVKGVLVQKNITTEGDLAV